MIDDKALRRAILEFSIEDEPGNDWTIAFRKAIEAYEIAKASGQPSEAEVREAFEREMKIRYGIAVRYHEHHAYGAFQDKYVGFQACNRWRNEREG